MAEFGFKAPVLKTGGPKGPVGSNPTASAILFLEVSMPFKVGDKIRFKSSLTNDEESEEGRAGPEGHLWVSIMSKVLGKEATIHLVEPKSLGNNWYKVELGPGIENRKDLERLNFWYSDLWFEEPVAPLTEPINTNPLARFSMIED